MSEQPNLRQRILLREFYGKHKAAQTYDEIIWKIRSGSLTLTFAAWGALLAMSNGDLRLLSQVSGALWLVTSALAVAGFCVEKNYEHRKARCVRMINEMAPAIYKAIEQPNTLMVSDEWLRFSGDEPQSGLMPEIKERRLRFADWLAGMRSMIINWKKDDAAMIHFIPALAILLAVVALNLSSRRSPSSEAPTNPAKEQSRE